MAEQKQIDDGGPAFPSADLTYEANQWRPDIVTKGGMIRARK